VSGIPLPGVEAIATSRRKCPRLLYGPKSFGSRTSAGTLAAPLTSGSSFSNSARYALTASSAACRAIAATSTGSTAGVTCSLMVISPAYDFVATSSRLAAAAVASSATASGSASGSTSAASAFNRRTPTVLGSAGVGVIDTSTTGQRLISPPAFVTRCAALPVDKPTSPRSMRRVT